MNTVLLKKATVTQLVIPEGSLLYSQGYTTGPYPEVR